MSQVAAALRHPGARAAAREHGAERGRAWPDRRPPALLVQPHARAIATSSSPILAGMLLTQPLPERSARSASSASARAEPSSRRCRCPSRPSRSCSASCCRWWRWATRCSPFTIVGERRSVFGIWPRGSWLGLVRRHAALHAGLARHRRARLDARAHLGAGRLHHRVLHHAVVRALGRHVARTSSCRRRCALVGGVIPLRWYQIALRAAGHAGRGHRGGRWCPCVALLAIFAVPAGA